jgi:ABC-type tungstate transport system substrate-binding protein
MSELIDGLREALRLIATGDEELREIAMRTLVVSGSATLLAMLVGVPAGYALARGKFPGRTFLLATVNTGMGMPPVVVGLVVWLMLIRSGPFGDLELIYTKRAMVIAQLFIAIPWWSGSRRRRSRRPGELRNCSGCWGRAGCERSG